MAGKRYPSSVGIGTRSLARSVESRTATVTDSAGTWSRVASSGSISVRAKPSGMVTVVTTGRYADSGQWLQVTTGGRTGWTARRLHP